MSQTPADTAPVLPTATTSPHPTLTTDLLQRFDVNGPRHAAYPTADRLGYLAALQAGELPVEGGIVLNPDDVARRAAMLALMSEGRLLFADFERAPGVQMQRDFGADEAPVHLQPRRCERVV